MLFQRFDMVNIQNCETRTIINTLSIINFIDLNRTGEWDKQEALSAMGLQKVKTKPAKMK